MADAEPEEVTPAAESPAPAAVSPKPKKGKATKKAAAASRKPTKAKAPKPAGERKVPTHPPTGQLVNEAIGKLNERGGSSLQAIKKSIADSHKFDVEKLGPFIRKYLKSAVEKGSLVQTKGKGANGSFKLPPKEKKAKPAAEKSPNDALEVQVKEPAAAKEASKSKSSKKPATVKKAAKPVKAKSPTKPKAPTAPKVASTKAAPKSKVVKAPAVEKKRESPAVENKAKAAKAEKPKVKAPAKPKVAMATRNAAAVPASAIN